VYSSIPVLGQGIKINHSVDSYKDHVVFWTLRNPQRLIEKIERTGFLNPDLQAVNSPDEEVTEIQKKREVFL
jgi:hypothetical protein